MPKVVLPLLPLSGLFGVVKPSGPTSMSVVEDVKHLVNHSRLFVASDKLRPLSNRFRGKRRAKDPVKTGQGGTLDPLADGVLVIGVGKGTKKLAEFLDCSKEYQTTCLLGCETDSYDSEGARVRIAPWKHVSKAQVETALAAFRGEISQTPPIFSALKMDGMPLYDYARRGIPLPRPIEPRKTTVHSLELVEWIGDNHKWRWPKKALTDEEKKKLQAALEGAGEQVNLQDALPMPSEGEGKAEGTEIVKDGEEEEGSDITPTAFVLKMSVSSGTYVRSIVHDLAHALGSAGHVVTLTRTRQGKFVLDTESDPSQASTETSDLKSCVPWEILSRACADSNPELEVDEDGWAEWEREVIQRMEIVAEGGGKKTN